MTQSEPQYIDTPIARFAIFENDIVLVRVKGNMAYPLEQVKATYRKCRELAGERKVAVLVDGTEVRYTDITGEVLRYMADNEHVPMQLANALLVNNISLRRIANIYLDLFRPRVPTRIFNTEEEAVQWLRYCIGTKK